MLALPDDAGDAASAAELLCEDRRAPTDRASDGENLVAERAHYRLLVLSEVSPPDGGGGANRYLSAAIESEATLMDGR